MGSFFGHALPGSFFLMFGIWWCVQIYRRYFESLSRRGRPYSSTATFPVRLSSRWRDVHIESILAIVTCAIGILVEAIIAPIFHHTHIGTNNTQHATMYAFFLMAAAIVLVSVRLHMLPNPLDVQYVSLALAFLVEGLLFKFHVMGRTGPDILIHDLLLYAIWGCVGATVIEMAYKDNVLAAMARSFFTILQGTWFWQAGFFLYNPFKGDSWAGPYDHHHEGQMTRKEEHEMHENQMFFVSCYAWHMGAIFLLMLITGAVIGCRSGSSEELRDMRLVTSSESAKVNGYSHMLEEDEEEEEEGQA